MANLDADINLSLKDAGAQGEILNYTVTNGNTVFRNAVVGLHLITHGTASSRGKVERFSNQTHMIPIGIAMKQVTGTAAGAEVPVMVFPGTAVKITVAGVAGDVTDVGRTVYLATDNINDATVVHPSNPPPPPLGVITRFLTATTFEVRLFSAHDHALMAAGGLVKTVFLGTVDMSDVDAAGGETILNPYFPFAGQFKGFWGVWGSDSAGSGASAALNLDIGGTNVTGGVVTLVEADVLGGRKDGTAITAANVFDSGSDIKVEVASGGTNFTGGTVNLFASYIPIGGK